VSSAVGQIEYRVSTANELLIGKIGKPYLATAAFADYDFGFIVIVTMASDGSGTLCDLRLVCSSPREIMWRSSTPFHGRSSAPAAVNNPEF
jgi:hypothetical protein